MTDAKLRLIPSQNQSEITDRFTTYDITNPKNPELDFSILLPNDWQIEASEEAATAEIPITVLFKARPKKNHDGSNETLEVMISSVFLPREVHPTDWLIAWTKSRNLQVLDQRLSPSPFGILADVLATGSTEGQARTHRITTFKDGSLLFVVDSWTTQISSYNSDSIQDIFLLAIIRFQLHNPTKQRFAEPFSHVTLPGTQALQLFLPDSWEQKFSDDAPAGGSALLVENKVNENIVGTMVIASAPESQASIGIEKVTLNKLTANGYKITQPNEGILNASNDTFKLFLTLRNAEINGSKVYIVAARFEHEQVSGSMILISPTPEINFEAWAINRRALDIAMESLNFASN